VSTGRDGSAVRHFRFHWVGSPDSGGYTGGCPTDMVDATDSLAELLDALVRGMSVHRVLWAIASGRNRYDDLIASCEDSAVAQAITSGLIVEPLDEDLLPPYHLTDAGRNLLIRWRREVTRHLDRDEFLAVWEVVTQR
jgi:hypothetical protein